MAVKAVKAGKVCEKAAAANGREAREKAAEIYFSLT